jgi:hypothetical protein
MARVTKQEVESMFSWLITTLGKESGTGDGQFRLEWWGQKCRIVRGFGEHGGISIPFQHTWLTKREAYEMFWFAARAIEIAQEE